MRARFKTKSRANTANQKKNNTEKVARWPLLQKLHMADRNAAALQLQIAALSVI